jgi:predicted DNA-binding ArsR family transcriptional regulator
MVSLLCQKWPQYGRILRNGKGQTAQKVHHGSKAKKALSFLLKKINALKKQLKPAKAENPKKSKAESLLSMEINLSNSSDEMEEYIFLPLLSVQLLHQLKILTPPLN